MPQPPPPSPAPQRSGAGDGRFDALVLAGGRARRLGGADKPGLTVGARTLLDRVLSACGEAGRTVVVGPRRPTYRPVSWALESPRGGGPLAALAAGLEQVGRGRVLVASADLPFVRRATVRALSAAAEAEDCDGAVVHDGRDQPLLAVYAAEPLRRELALLYAEHGTLAHLPVRLLLPGLRLRRVTSADALDCDTWDDLAGARSRIRDHGTVLDEWTAALKAELGIELDVDTVALLDLARDAAHQVARPAAPLTTFLVGYAAAARGDASPEAVSEAARKAVELARRWEAEQGTDTE
ncbi:NTP transferase domain-containing protein [Streptomyces sp. TR02-1]|uniref:NTP transferase domain-containing protein n=1 Tax=Streptomyces sp. TR02-1 TaxID=3385977 RepID=UPI0039A1CE14